MSVIGVERGAGAVLCSVDGCALYAIDVVRLDVHPLRIALHACRAHAVVLVHENGATWDAALANGDAEREARDNAQANALANRLRMVRP